MQMQYTINMANAASPDDRTITSFIIGEERLEQFKNRLPAHGDRSEVLRQLVDMFLDGRVKVTIPAREV